MHNHSIKSGLFAAVLVLISACSSKENKEKLSAEKPAPILVKIASPSENISNEYSISGQVEASQTANISTRVMGYITRLSVKVGDHVSSGQIIATISNSDLLAKRAQTEAQINEAEAALQNAKKDYDRFTTLYKQQSATAKELDNITLQYSAMKAKVEAAKQMRNEVNAMLAYTSLTAPFSGVVTQKMADAGNMANPGMPIVTIEQTGSYQISANVPETEINQLKQGENVKVTIKSIDRSFEGKITQINPSSQFTGGQYIIKIGISENDKKGLYAGMYANIIINSPGKSDAKAAENGAVLVPVSCIVNKEQLTGLYTISTDNTALLRWVRLGKQFGNQVEVLTGLNKNEPYILEAQGNLYNSAPVSIIK